MKKLLAIALAVVLMAMSSGVAMAAVGGAWATKAVHPEEIEGAAASLINGKIYVSHGMRSGGDSDNLTIYDIATDTWSAGADANVPRAELVGASAVGKHYAIGGRPAQSTVEIYDPATDTWSMGPAMPTARRGLGAATIGSKIYVVGGSTGTTPHSGTALATNEVLDTVAGTWTSLASMPTAMMGVYATVAFGGKVYVFGGYDGTNVSGAVQIYDPATDTWVAGTPMPTPRSNAVAGVCCGRIFVIGGYNGSNLTVNEVYDPATDTWDTAPAKPTAGSEFAVGDVSVGDKIYVIGSGIFGASDDTHEVFSPLFVQVDKVLIDEEPDDVLADGDAIIEVGEKWYFSVNITVTNPTIWTVTDVMVKDNLGGDLELVSTQVNDGVIYDWSGYPLSKKKKDNSLTQGEVTVEWSGKSEKAHLFWDVQDGTLSPGETHTLTIVVATDQNPAGQQEYSEAGTHELNSGATAKGLLDSVWPVTDTSDSIEVEVIEPN